MCTTLAQVLYIALCQSQVQKYKLSLHNSLYQKLSITFICFCNEDDQIIIHKIDFVLHRGFSQTPCHSENTSRPKKRESDSLQRFLKFKPLFGTDISFSHWKLPYKVGVETPAVASLYSEDISIFLLFYTGLQES